MLIAFLLFVGGLLFVPTLLREQRERRLAARLKETRNPEEALALMDQAMEQSKLEGKGLKAIKWGGFFLR